MAFIERSDCINWWVEPFSLGKKMHSLLNLVGHVVDRICNINIDYF